MSRHSRIRREYPLLLAPLVILLAVIWFPIPRRVDPAELYTPLFFRAVEVESLPSAKNAVPVPVNFQAQSCRLGALGRTTLLALPPEVRAPLSQDLSERVLARLEVCEWKENDPWFRDDIRIAWITTLEAAQGNPQPHVDATYRVLGVHPDQVWPRIMARRHALLAADYDKFYGGASSPRKPVRSATLDEVRRKGAAA